MKTIASIAKRLLGPLLLAGLTLSAASLMAADSPAGNTPPKSAAPSKAGKSRNPPFVGVIQKVDKSARTITLNGKDGGRTFYITAETRITKGGKPATLEDVVIGEEAAGTFKDLENKRTAVSLRLGPKVEKKPKEAK